MAACIDDMAHASCSVKIIALVENLRQYATTSSIVGTALSLSRLYICFNILSVTPKSNHLEYCSHIPLFSGLLTKAVK